MTLDQMLNLADRLAIYSGFQSSTVNIEILPVEAAFLSKILKSTIGGSMPSLPIGHGWFKGWPPENPKINDEVIFIDTDHDIEIATYTTGYGENGSDAWEGINIDPVEDNVLCWRPFDAPV